MCGNKIRALSSLAQFSLINAGPDSGAQIRARHCWFRFCLAAPRRSRLSSCLPASFPPPTSLCALLELLVVSDQAHNRCARSPGRAKSSVLGELVTPTLEAPSQPELPTMARGSRHRSQMFVTYGAGRGCVSKEAKKQRKKERMQSAKMLLGPRPPLLVSLIWGLGKFQSSFGGGWQKIASQLLSHKQSSIHVAPASTIIESDLGTSQLDTQNRLLSPHCAIRFVDVLTTSPLCASLTLFPPASCPNRRTDRQTDRRVNKHSLSDRGRGSNQMASSYLAHLFTELHQLC